MKVFTVAAALEAGVVRPDDRVRHSQPVLHARSAARPIRDTHPVPYLTTARHHQALVERRRRQDRACGSARERLHAALKQFGFGAKTGIELPGEQAGHASATARRGATIELATISFGYGLTVTPLQIAAALAALGNGGVYHAPRIVERVRRRRRHRAVSRPAAEPRQMVSRKTAEAMRAMLALGVRGAARTAGTAGTHRRPGLPLRRQDRHRAQVRPGDPAVLADNRYLSSFAGLAPIDNPRLAIVVMIDEPSGGDYYGGKVAGPVFATVASEALRYLGVPGDVARVPARRPPASCRRPRRRPASSRARPVPTPGRRASPPGRPPPPPALDDEPEADAEAPVAGAIEIPDFRGHGPRARARRCARASGLAVEVDGSGRVSRAGPGARPAPPAGPGRAAVLRRRFAERARLPAPR